LRIQILFAGTRVGTGGTVWGREKAVVNCIPYSPATLRPSGKKSILSWKWRKISLCLPQHC